MSKFIALTCKGDEWQTVFNFEYVVRIDPFDVKSQPASQLTFVDGRSQVVHEDFDTLVRLVEARNAQGT